MLHEQYTGLRISLKSKYFSSEATLYLKSVRMSHLSQMKIDRQIDMEMDRQKDKQIYRQMLRQRDKQRDNQIDRQKDRSIVR